MSFCVEHNAFQVDGLLTCVKQALGGCWALLASSCRETVSAASSATQATIAIASNGDSARLYLCITCVIVNRQLCSRDK
jgi:hypothetical protein